MCTVPIETVNFSARLHSGQTRTGCRSKEIIERVDVMIQAMG